MSSLVDIYNIALSYIGDAVVQSPTEQTTQAAQCSIHYPVARDSILRSFPWSFAKQVKTLALYGDAPQEWNYQYAYPADCLRVMSVVKPTRLHEEIEFEVARSGDLNARVIWTDEDSAQVKYISRVTDTSVYPQLFVDLLAASLASRVAMPLTRDIRIVQAMQEHYQRLMSGASAADAEEHNADTTLDAPWILER